MELREWLIILGLVLVATIVIDGFRRLQRQRRVPRLDRAAVEAEEGDAGGHALTGTSQDPEAEAREAEMNWELPNGGARVVRPATFERSQDAMEPIRPTEPKRQERIPDEALQSSILDRRSRSSFANMQANVKSAVRAGAKRMSESASRLGQKRDDVAFDETLHEEPRLGDFETHDTERPASHAGDDRLRIETLTPVGDYDRHPQTSSSRESQPRVAESEFVETGEALAQEPANDNRRDVVTPHPVVERAKRHHVNADRARETLSHADEIIVISVLARNEEGFDGTTLLKLMLACGLRFSEMGIFHRFETEESDSELQFSMVNVLKPGVFDLDRMDEIVTPGVSFLMPLPGANDTSVAFEAMLETAMVVVRNLGGELKDENHSVMTAQTIEFARQRVQDFERRHRLHRYQAN